MCIACSVRIVFTTPGLSSATATSQVIHPGQVVHPGQATLAYFSWVPLVNILQLLHHSSQVHGHVVQLLTIRMIITQNTLITHANLHEHGAGVQAPSYGWCRLHESRLMVVQKVVRKRSPPFAYTVQQMKIAQSASDINSSMLHSSQQQYTVSKQATTPCTLMSFSMMRMIHFICVAVVCSTSHLSVIACSSRASANANSSSLSFNTPTVNSLAVGVPS